jgi:predicted PurR-regulated permease PerM
MKQHEHPLSWNAIFRVIAAGIILTLVWKLQSQLTIIFVSLMLASAMYPIVKWLSKRMPVVMASVLVIGILFLPVIMIAVNVIPSLVQQFPEIARAVNTALKSAVWIPDSVKNIDLTQYSSNAGSYLLQSTSVITSILTTFITIVFLTLYFLIDSKKLLKLILWMIPDDQEEKTIKFAEKLADINGQYIRGNLFISFICGICIYVGLRLLSVPYAGSLALFAAVADLLPLVGAYLGAAPAIILGFSISPSVGILVSILFLVYQQFENTVISPNVYNKTLDLSPALSFIAVIFGASLFGMVGAFASLPLAASIPTILEYFRDKNKHKSGEV